jgi:hypothetical protein
MESASIDDETRPALSRLRIILAILACTVVPAWLLVVTLSVSPEPLFPPLFVALFVSLVRGVTVAGRWLALGPGRLTDRATWSIFIIAMLTLAPFAAMEESEAPGAWLLIPYFAIQTVYWRVAGIIGEREDVGERYPRSRIGLQDALVVLALFCIVVAGIRAQIGWRDVDLSFPIAFFFLVFCAILSVAGLVLFLCDLGMRAAIRSRSWRGRRTGIAVAAFTTIIAIVCVLGVSVDRWSTDFVVSGFGFIAAYVVCAAMQETVLAVSGFVATVHPEPGGG